MGNVPHGHARAQYSIAALLTPVHGYILYLLFLLLCSRELDYLFPILDHNHI